jgi:hypothetical protein
MFFKTALDDFLNRLGGFLNRLRRFFKPPKTIMMRRAQTASARERRRGAHIMENQSEFLYYNDGTHGFKKKSGLWREVKKLTQVLPVVKFLLIPSNDNMGIFSLKGIYEQNKSLISLHGQLGPQSDGGSISPQIC